MKAVVIDSNVLLSFLTDRHPRQGIEARQFFVGASEHRVKVLIPQFVLFEVAFVMLSVYRSAPTTVSAFLERSLTMPGISVTDDCSWKRLLSLWPDLVPDLTDAALAAIAIEQDLNVATFDRKLIKRLERLEIGVWSG